MRRRLRTNKKPDERKYKSCEESNRNQLTADDLQREGLTQAAITALMRVFL